MDFLLVNLVIVLDALLVEQADLVHLLDDAVDEEVNLLLSVPNADHRDVRLRLIVVLLVEPPLQRDDVWMVQVSTHALERV